jgi:branched-chain amino acid transport system substrate-binding protein
MDKLTRKYRFGKVIFLLLVCTLGSSLICVLGSPSAAQAQKLIIGVLVGLTGSTAEFGNQAQSMTKLIDEEIQEAGGITIKGKKVEVLFKYYDTESTAEVSSIATQRAISDGVQILIAAPQSAATFSASERSERAGVPMIDPYCTTDRLTERGFKYYFRVGSPNDVAVQESMHYLLWQEKRTGVRMKNVAIFTVDNVTGTDKGNAYAKWIPKLAPHWNIEKHVAYPPATRDFTVYLSDLKSKGVEALLGLAYPNDSILITRQLREINYNVKAIHGVHGGHYNPEYGEVLQWQAIGTTNTCWFAPFSKGIPGLTELNEKYKKRYGVDIPQNAANVAVAISLAIEVAQRASSLDPEAFRKALVSTDLTKKGYKKGEWWWIETCGAKFDEKGQNIRMTSTTSVWSTPTRFEVVYPEEFAQTVTPWPRLTWEELEKKYARQFPLGKK